MFRVVLLGLSLLLVGCLTVSEAPKWCRESSYWPHIQVRLGMIHEEFTIRYVKNIQAFVTGYNMLPPQSSFRVPQKIALVDVRILPTVEVVFIVDDCVINVFKVPRRILRHLRGIAVSI